MTQQFLCKLCGNERAIFKGMCPTCWNKGPDKSEHQLPDFRHNKKKRWRKPRTVSVEDHLPEENNPPLLTTGVLLEAGKPVPLDLYKPENWHAYFYWAPWNPRRQPSCRWTDANWIEVNDGPVDPEPEVIPAKNR